MYPEHDTPETLSTILRQTFSRLDELGPEFTRALARLEQVPAAAPVGKDRAQRAHEMA